MCNSALGLQMHLRLNYLTDLTVQFLLILGCRVLPYLENSTKEGEVEQLHSDKEER